jgi:uncharacterized membrane protein
VARRHRDATGFRSQAGLAEHLDLACGQLRRVAAHEPRVVVALLVLLAEVARRVTTETALGDVRREADLLVADARRRIGQAADLDTVEGAYAALPGGHLSHVGPAG